MAIDTAEKRRSACGAFLMPINPTVTPDAAQGADWRAEALWIYGGLDSYAAAVTSRGAYFTVTVGRLMG